MIHFSHGNGFPAETYQRIIADLQGQHGFKVGYISCLGHNPNYPVAEKWDSLVQELIDYISSNYQEKVIGVGHSLGGVITYWACLLRPDLFKAVILLDSPIYSPIKYLFIRIIKSLGLMDYFTPARNTKNRRLTWDSHQAAIEHFSHKKAFRHFDPRCLQDYVHWGTEEIKDYNGQSMGIKLRFDPLIEWKIYRSISMANLEINTLPEHIPCALIYGEHSKVISDNDATSMAARYNVEVQKIHRCGHLFPFEQPEATVNAIIKFLAAHHIA